jgi:hypothetical protein
VSGTHTISTPHDLLPDFGAHPTATPRSVVGWSSLAVWGGRLPGAADTAAVPAGVTVVYDHYAGAPIRALSVEAGGALHLAGGSRLIVTDFLIKEGGRLTIDPGAEVVLSPGPFRADDPRQYGCGLLCLGDITARGTPKTHRARLARAPRPGDRTIELDAAPSGWRAGDRLAIPQYYPGMYWERQALKSLVVRMSSVSGRTVTLDSPYQGILQSAGFLPFVSNLTRDIVFRSADPSGVRGHTQFLHNARVDLRHCAFVGLGRTPAFGGQVGRYAVHMHHLLHPHHVEGCVIEDATKWSLAVHDCHSGSVTNTVARGATHACFATEDGSESGLTWRGNVALDCKVGEPDPEFNDAGGYGYWPNGRADCVFEGNAAYNCGWAWWAPGLRAAPSNWRVFRGNEDEGCEGGVYLDHTKTGGGPLLIEDHRSSTHCGLVDTGAAVFSYDTDGVIVRNLQAWASLVQVSSERSAHLDRCRIEGAPWAVYDVSHTVRPLTVTDSQLLCPVGVYHTLSHSAGTGAGEMPPPGSPWKALRVERTTCPGVLVLLAGTPDESPSSVPCILQTVDVVQPDGRAYRCFRDGSAPGAPCPSVADVPPSDTLLIVACPTAGLTNAQAWARHGVAFAGAVMPAGAASVPWLTGGKALALPPQPVGIAP